LSGIQNKNPLDITSDSTNVNAVKYAYEKAIENEIRFYNMSYPDDNVLEFVHPVNEDLLFPLSL
jgi:hypothetical protein